MAEAHAVEAVEDMADRPIMPHLEYPERIDELHPPLRVPDEVDDTTEEVWMDQRDQVFQHGLALARAIAETTIVHGRRRLER
jgi:hypothetical protein